MTQITKVEISTSWIKDSRKNNARLLLMDYEWREDYHVFTFVLKEHLIRYYSSESGEIRLYPKMPYFDKSVLEALEEIHANGGKCNEGIPGIAALQVPGYSGFLVLDGDELFKDKRKYKVYGHSFNPGDKDARKWERK